MEGIEGKQVKIFYDDFGKVSRKDGILTKKTETECTLDNRIIIPLTRIIRIEVTQ